MPHKMHNLALLALLPLIGLCLSGCPMYTMVAFKHDKAADQPGGGSLGDYPSEVKSVSTEITLAWDPPPTPIQSYELFFRIHDAADWYSLAAGLPDDPEPEYTVQHAAVGNGIFDFGVKAVNAEAVESSMHQSLETSAQPDTGWYLVWE